MSNNPFKNNPTNTPNAIDKSLQPRKRTIEVGKFYLVFDGSKTGHPGLVIWKNDDQNRYLVIRTNSDKKGKLTKEEMGEKHITKLRHATDKNVINSYVHNRPMLCKRKDIGNKVLTGMKFHKEDQHLIKEISCRKYEVASSFRKNNKLKLKKITDGPIKPTRTGYMQILYVCFYFSVNAKIKISQ